MDSKEIQTLRNMAICRAIGEIEAALHASYDNEYYKYVAPKMKQAIELLKDCK